jgi:hypothetical protein
VYPRWAQFIGAVIILITVLPIPIVLIGRLILYQSAREEAVGFFKSLRSDAEDLFRYISHLRSVAILLKDPRSPLYLFLHYAIYIPLIHVYSAIPFGVQIGGI